MTPPQPSPEETSGQGEPQTPRAAFWRRIERAAGDLNPLLLVFTLGLLILDLTCYVGLEVSRGPFLHASAVVSARAAVDK